MPLCNADLIGTYSAAVNASVGGSSAGRDQRIEGLVLRLGQKLAVFVQSQDGLLST